MKAFKTAFLLSALTLLMLLIGEALAGPRGLEMAFVFALLMNGGAYFFSDKIALMSSGAVPISREQAPRLYQVMERLAGKANLPMPKLYLIPQPAPNAFATGRNPSHASVAVTQGLLDLMNDEELEGVIAHELSHVRNYDILTSSIAATIAGVIFIVSRMGFFFGGGRDRERGGGALALVLMILAPFAAMLLQLGISRQREYQADASGAKMDGHQYGLIRALEKLGAYNKRIPTDMPPTTAALCIIQPLTAGEIFSNLFSTHPPLAKRIEQLRNMTITR
jgi:heat shock protein HtpX